MPHAREGATRVQDEATHVQDGATHVRDEATHVQEDASPVQEDASPVREGATHVREDATHVQDDATHVREGAHCAGSLRWYRAEGNPNPRRKEAIKKSEGIFICVRELQKPYAYPWRSQFVCPYSHLAFPRWLRRTLRRRPSTRRS